MLVNPDGTFDYDPTAAAAIQALDEADTSDDTFSYTITDIQGAMSTATVTITLTGINDGPVAADDAGATDEDTALGGTVFGNDSDVDEDDVLGTNVTVTGFDATSALGATVLVNPDGTFDYDPTAAAAIQALDEADTSDDTFSYTITDIQGAMSTATVTITLTGINDAPVALDPDLSQAPLGAPFSENDMFSTQIGTTIGLEEFATDIDSTLTVGALHI